MKKTHSRVLAAVTALVAGGLAAFALRPAQAPSSQALASRNPAVEVRTQVIRRTIHVKRHQPAAGAGSHLSSALAAQARGPARSGASGSHAAGAVAGAVATRTSGSHAVAVTGSGAPVTRTSGASGAATGAGTAVRTRTSGAGGTAGRPTTRSSGGGERGDGGGDN